MTVMRNTDLHDGHEEHSHVEHGGDAQGDLLPGLSWNQENKPEISFFILFISSV